MTGLRVSPLTREALRATYLSFALMVPVLAGLEATRWTAGWAGAAFFGVALGLAAAEWRLYRRLFPVS